MGNVSTERITIRKNFNQSLSILLDRKKNTTLSSFNFGECVRWRTVLTWNDEKLKLRERVPISAHVTQAVLAPEAVPAEGVKRQIPALSSRRTHRVRARIGELSAAVLQKCARLEEQRVLLESDAHRSAVFSALAAREAQRAQCASHACRPPEHLHVLRGPRPHRALQCVHLRGYSRAQTFILQAAALLQPLNVSPQTSE